VAPPRPAIPEFESVYRAEFSYVYRVLRYLGAPPADVEDLAHDVFVVVHRRLAEFDTNRPMRPWLSGIAYHLVTRHRQRFSHRNEVATGDPLDPPSDAPGAEARVAAAEAWTIVCAAIAELPLEQRAVFVMHDLEELSAPDIAEALGAPLNTIYSRLRLGRAKFATAMRLRGVTGEEP
jgi:RNA polymerase sigma-70 factor (ECF subfamily)